MTEQKSILFAMARMTPPFFFGGAEKSNLTLALRLQVQHKVKVAFCGSYTHFQKNTDHLLVHYLQYLEGQQIPYQFSASHVLHYVYQGIECEMTPKHSYLKLLSYHMKRHKYNIVVTMLEFAPEIINLCNEMGLPVILWIMDTFDLGTKPLVNHAQVDHIIFTSYYLKRELSNRFGCSGRVFYPLFEFDWYRSQTRNPRSITMINPIPEKGYSIFLKIAENLANRHFLAVEGWRPVNLGLPQNMTYLHRQNDMRCVYAQTRVLLVPSTWPEAFGRVIVEACINGIPVIASNIGGIPEAMGDSGILIDDICDVSAWVEAVQTLDDMKTYTEFSRRALANADRFSQDWCGQFLELIP